MFSCGARTLHASGIAAILLLVVVCECLPGENLAQRAHTREQERREAADSMRGGSQSARLDVCGSPTQQSPHGVFRSVVPIVFLE